MQKQSLILSFLVLISNGVDAFCPSLHGARHETTVYMAKGRGRKNLRKTLKDNAGSGVGINKLAGEENVVSAKKTNWVPVSGVSSMDDLPKDENKVKVVDTMAPSLMNGATNPTGAVSVVNYEGSTYCFSSSCSSCQFPMIKAKVLPPNEETNGVNPRVSCDFCKATYNIKTGEVLETAPAEGLMGGIMKGVFSAQEKKPLPTYDLGEKNGQVLINLP